MSDSHRTEQEQWLVEQGAHVKNMRPLRRYYAEPPFLSSSINDDPSAMTAVQYQAKHFEEQVYTVEVRSSTVKQWQAMDKRMSWTTGDNEGKSWGNPTNWLVQWRRHQQLLDQNEMYRQAWLEFQSIRALIGEATDWP